MWMLLSVIPVNALNTIGRRGVVGGLFLNSGIEHHAPLCVDCKFFTKKFSTIPQLT